MTLVYACVAPHGGEIIPELASKPMLRKFEETRAAMRVLARRISEAQPQTIVIASPHNLRLLSNIAVVVSENSSGTLKGSSNRSVAVRARCDVDFGKIVVRQSEKARLPVVARSPYERISSSGDCSADS
jgi:aromatic ring-opening dioxygenase LigB subunit